MNSRLKCNSVFRDYLVGGFEAEAFSGRAVIAFQEAGEAVCGQRIEVGLSGQLAAQRPMAFSMPLFCHGEWVSQNHVSMPNLRLSR
jgi:hypothetical protein